MNRHGILISRLMRFQTGVCEAKYARATGHKTIAINCGVNLSPRNGLTFWDRTGIARGLIQTIIKSFTRPLDPLTPCRRSR